MNRRQFVLGSAAVAAVATLGPGLLRRNVVQADEQEPIVVTEWIDEFGSDGSVYFCDEDLFSVSRRRADGSSVWDVGKPPIEEGGFNVPRGVALSVMEDRLYVADTGNARVKVLDIDGRMLFEFGSYGTDDGQFTCPTDLLVGPDGTVYVADFLGHNVQVFSADGQFLRTIGMGLGADDGQFNGPRGLALHPDGTLHVVDTGNCRVQIFSTTGTHLGSYGSYGMELGQFLAPRAIAIDSTGRRYVADAVAGYVTMYPASGDATKRFQPEIGFGRTGIPVNLAIAPDDRLYVTAIPVGMNYTSYLPIVRVERGA